MIMMMLENKKKNLQLKFLVCLSFVGVCVCCVCGLVSKNFLFFFLVKTRKKKKRNFFLLVIFYTPLLVMVTILLNIEVFWNIIDL